MQQRTTLAAAVATLLAFSAPVAWSDTPVGSHAARKALEAQFLKADPQATVYIDENFSGVADEALPANWRVQPKMKGKAKVTGGNLLIDGTPDASGMTGVMLPVNLETLSNYRIDMEFTMDSAVNTSRWASVMYRTSPLNTKQQFEPYYQFAVRQSALDDNGTELAFRSAASTWDVQSKKPFSEVISKNKRYKATVIVHGNRVRQYLNGTLLHDTTISSAANAKGGVGVQTSGALVRVYSVKVTEQKTPLPELELPVLVQDTGTAASMAPTLVQGMTSLATREGDGSSNSLFTLDSALNLNDASGQKLGTLEDYLAQARRVTVPVLRVKDQATVDALGEYSFGGPTLADITLLSDDPVLLKYARTQLPQLRTAVDFTAVALTAGTEAVLKITGDTNRAGAKIAVLPAALATRETVSHLQRLLITVWAVSDARTAQDAALVLTTGVNGVLASDSTVFADVMRKLPAGTLLRKPLIAGHRGMPAGGEHDENTMESAQAAVAAGADAVENDIYITKDGHLVIMHDASVVRTTNGTGNIESMTLEQVKALRTKPQGLQIPTMREYFKAFKNKPITHFIEIKSSTPSVVTRLKQEIQEEGVADQTVAISFSSPQLKLSAEQIPELTLGFLNSSNAGADVRDGVRKVLEATQQNNSTFNPSYSGISRPIMEAAKHRGTTFWPWTLNTANDFYKYYSWGTHGLTTDYAKWAANFPVAIKAAALPAKIALNEAASLEVTLTTQTGESTTARANEMVLLGGTATAQTPTDGTITFTSAGTAVVLPGYRYKMGDGTYSYVLMAQPVTLTVGDGSGGVTGTSNSASAGAVSCSSAVPGQTSACSVTPQPGYAVTGAAPGGDCPAGAWNADRTIYTTGVVSGNCSVNFTFAPLPVEAPLSPVGKSGVVQAKVTGGGTGLWAFDAGNAMSVSVPTSTPDNLSFPFGVTGFTLKGGEAGKQAVVELTYPQALPTDAKYYKYGKTQANAQAHWYEFAGAQISGNKVTLTLTDGGDGDNDLAANGFIVDPGGLGVTKAEPVMPGTPTAVPSLGAGAVLTLSWAVGALAWLRSRRRDRKSALTR
ncbi:glycerophosphodiester phosphodiesterase family protein [Diaphorobacter aerolatus]|uniref:DUF1080 domain-containing protein n=1 Tax=Diaphorobacter aerolatus TaxID=1288495 RepID=A0A7H0GMF4_9BURK|nr:glycerophosphodiester phosphodiesterase family protein [Diaphorobacter aerolatus]QNP49470.1 DUF1080 domain-containing protein [Diaphorobacter aerolatus]